MLRPGELWALIGGAFLVACGPVIPDSGAGVGFGEYSTYELRRAQRDAAQAARRDGLVPQTPAARSAGAPAISGDELRSAGLPVAEGVEAAPLDGTAFAAAGGTAQGAGTAGSAGAPETSHVGISDEQNFDAVASRESIESDKARLEENRRNYQQVQPVALPGRAGATDTVVIDFALSTTNPVGQAKYARSGRTSQDRYYRACAKYPSQDAAQEDFLKAGGPQKDGKGIDPDGDGFACFWDPTPFRLAREGAVAAPVAREVLPGEAAPDSLGAGGVLVRTSDLDKTPLGN